MSLSYRIGIEVELLLAPKLETFGSYERLATVAGHVVSECNQSLGEATQLRNKVVRGTSRPRNWSLKGDNSISPNDDRTFPFELVSPVLDYDQTNRWRADLREIFQAFGTVCDIETNNTCGVHIHISSKHGSWGLKTVKELCRNIFYFEDVINTLVPEHRVRTDKIQSNLRDTPSLDGKTPRECLSIINKCYTMYQVIDVVNNYSSRYFAWNFINLLRGGRGTIEFRQPPGEDNADRVLQWAEFVVLFLHAAHMMVPFERLCWYPRNLQGLLDFLSIHQLPGSDLQALERLFRESPGAQNDTSLEGPQPW